jgi:hypothetical protein
MWCLRNVGTPSVNFRWFLPRRKSHSPPPPPKLHNFCRTVHTLLIGHNFGKWSVLVRNTGRSDWHASWFSLVPLDQWFSNFFGSRRTVKHIKIFSHWHDIPRQAGTMAVAPVKWRLPRATPFPTEGSSVSFQCSCEGLLGRKPAGGLDRTSKTHSLTPYITGPYYMRLVPMGICENQVCKAPTPQSLRERISQATANANVSQLQRAWE